jgi:multicomponent Na+:H+ antiporter subunit F
MIEIVIYLLMASAVICVIRILLGPTAPDRVIAFDALVSILISFIVVLAVFYNSNIFLDIALVYAVSGFIGTLVISKYLMGKKLGDK